MLERLRQRLRADLSKHATCILSVTGKGGVWAMPVQYSCNDLEVVCLLPRWADLVYLLEQEQEAVLLFQNSQIPPLRWVQMRGVARLEACKSGAAYSLASLGAPSRSDLYRLVYVVPQRVDWIDESQGWGILDTLDF